MINLFEPVDDWYNNIHYAYNPKSILIEKEKFHKRWQELFSVAYIPQTNEETFEANSIWLSLKKNFISGSEVGSALGESPWETNEDYILFKSGKITKNFSEFTKNAMLHGKKNEDKAALFYTEVKEEITFKFGIIPHQDSQWKFLGVSPDLLSFFNEKPIEIKCPFSRELCYLENIKKNENINVLINETLISGNKYKYLTITNLPIHYTKLLDYYITYWHQCQLQAEVLDIGNSIDFIQLGISPNKFYNNSTLLTITNIPRDKMWLSNYGNKLRKTWDEIQYQITNSKKRKNNEI